VLPRKPTPHALSRRSEPFDSNDYIFVLKIDGFRSVTYIETGGNLSSCHKPLASSESEENNFRQNLSWRF
jgi:hypothetical protein